MVSTDVADNRTPLYKRLLPVSSREGHRKYRLSDNGAHRCVFLYFVNAPPYCTIYCREGARRLLQTQDACTCSAAARMAANRSCFSISSSFCKEVVYIVKRIRSLLTRVNPELLYLVILNLFGQMRTEGLQQRRRLCVLFKNPKIPKSIVTNTIVTIFVLPVCLCLRTLIGTRSKRASRAASFLVLLVGTEHVLPEHNLLLFYFIPITSTSPQ